ncbi:MAG: FKBP-type peptidyl-prolyl cis-trans isomerase [Akkermansiaceae bacterium]
MKYPLFGMALVLLIVSIFLILEKRGGAEKDNSEHAGKSSQLVSAATVGDLEDEGARSRKASLRDGNERNLIITTESGLQYEVLEEGAGDAPGPEDIVEVNYEGRLEDGMIFDSTYERNQAASFSLNAVIKGWAEGLQLMKPGAKYRLIIPSHLAYGKRGAGKQIPGGAVLIFEVELLSVKTRN